MDIDFEREVSQNVAFCSWALWECCHRFDDQVDSARGIPLPQMFLVLPLTLSKRVADTIQTKNMTEGSFFRALTEDRSIMAGLQRRLHGQAVRTRRALNLSFASGLIRLDRDVLEVYPGRKSLPGQPAMSSLAEDFKRILFASRRLGYWMATTEFSVICNLLKVRY